MKEIINFESEIFDLSKINPLVTRYKMFIAYSNEPANNYIFSEDVLNNLSATIMGCPVVAGFMNKEDGRLLGGHESDLAKDQNNLVKPTPKPIPVGFAAYDVIPWWEEYQDKNYLTTFVYIWDGRFPELENLSDRKIFQSMEVAVDFDNDGKFKIVSEAFALGLCLLENVEPAFTNSHIEKFSFSDIKDEVNSLKKEFEGFSSKYDDLDFTIPSGVKNSAQKGLDLHKEYNRGGTSVGLATARYLVKNTTASPEKVRHIAKYFPRHAGDNLDDKTSNGWIAWQLWGGDAGRRWSTKLVEAMNKRDEEKMSYFSDGEKIEIDNSKESSIDGEWSNPESKLYNPILEASNKKSLIKEAYLEYEDGYEESPSTKLKYPHHVIRDGKLVVHVRGVESAFSRVKQQGLTGEPINHIKKHYKELGLNMENFSTFGLTKEDYFTYFKEDGENMEEKDKVEMAEESVEKENKEGKVEEMSTEEKAKETDSEETEQKEETKTEEMSSNAYVDNTAVQELNENKAEENKELSDEQLKVEDDKDNVIAGLTAELSDIKEKMSKMEADMAVYMDENSKLKEFKANIEKQNKNFEVETTLKEVMSILPSEEIDACRLSADNFSIENIDAWKNEVKAKAFNFSKGIIEKKPFIQVGLPISSDKGKKGTGLWD